MARRTKSAETANATSSARGTIDYPFLILVIVLMAIGLLMLFSASYATAYYENQTSTYYFTRQAIFAVSGIAIMFIVSFMDYHIFKMWSPVIMLVTIALLVIVLFIGKGNFGEKRWLDLGFIQFQPSEFAKLAVILLFSAMISSKAEKMHTFRYGVLPYVTILAVLAGLMFLEPHLSGAILIVGVGAALMFMGGTHWGWFAGAIGTAVVAGAAAISFLDYARQRVQTWLDPFLDPRGDGYQIIQSLYAIGSGGALGLGFGNSRQKYLYLPEAHNDFIFAIVCEELGFVGAMIILILFALLIIRGYWIALHARDKFGSLLAGGVTTMVALQTVLNVGVVTGVLPVTGASLPFFSYGGTALWMLFFEMGIVLSVSRYIPAKKAG
ncbi:MAG: putative lipid II flippase FtsW [Oscillospiraceae bacterium]|nr:putative lipid II flippase FtsW [Oscillospiraceae bacterium]MBQ4544210.1 putative lipid II flippase FtsW [Oscillospiraceae bacterium]MBQ6901760.1 putative lipid II flippase FtsW [Oscillospiraceae bacterium]